jgi:predicted ATPase
MPDADIFELTTDGIDKVEWEDLALVANWRDFMTAPQAFIRHLLPDQS